MYRAPTHVYARMWRPAVNMSYLPWLLSTPLRPSPLMNRGSLILDSLAIQLAQEIPCTGLPSIGLQAAITHAQLLRGF